MNRRSKNRLILLIWLFLFFLLGIGVWHFQAGHLMLVMFLTITVFVYGVYAFSVKCPVCGRLIMLKPLRMLGLTIYMWTLLIPARCRHCRAAIE